MKNKTTEVLFIILIVLTILLTQATAFKDFAPVLFSDNAIYATLSNRFFNEDYDRAMHIWWQPFLPFVASLIMHFGVSDTYSLYLINLVSGALVFVPVFYLTRSITNNNFFSLIAGLLTSFNDKLIGSYFQLLTENLYVFLFTSAVFFSYLFLKEKKYLFIILASIFYSLGYLTRSDILLPIQIFAVSAVILLIFRNITLKKFLFSTLAASIIFIAVISPYLYFNVQKFGYLNLSAKLNASLWMPAYFAPQQNITTTYAQEVWSIDTPNYDSRYFNEKFDFWKYKTNMLDGAKERFYSYIKILKSENPKTEIILFVFGFIASTIYFFRFLKPGLYLNALLLINFFFSLPFQPGVDLRYLFWAYPLIITFFIFGYYWLYKIAIFILNKYKLIKFSPIINAAALASLIIFFFFYPTKDNLTLPSSYNKNTLAPDSYKIVGEYLKSIDNTNPQIMFRREPLAYYAKAQTIYIPTSIGTDELKAYASLWGADYLVADRFTFAPETPLGYLVDETKAPTWLKPVKTWEGNITKTVLYKFEI